MSSRGSNRPANRAGGELVIFIADFTPQLAVLGRKRRLVMNCWSTVAEVKSLLQARLHVPAQLQRLHYRGGAELKNHRSLQDEGVVRSGATLLWSLEQPGGAVAAPGGHLKLEPAGDSKCPRLLRHALLQAKRALLTGKAPQLSLDGTGGCYLLSDPRGQPVVCFKPKDEEPFQPNNPRGGQYTADSQEEVRMRHGVPPGSSCFREAGAYRLDTAHHAGVPQTSLALCAHPRLHYRDRVVVPKLGSLQAFVPSLGVAEDYSFSRFSVEEVHKIAILDMRILNCDRNAGNLLVLPAAQGGGGPCGGQNPAAAGAEGLLSLVPIDHGYAFPEVLEIGLFDWCWLDWAQCKEPLGPETLRHVLVEVDPEQDAARVRDLLPTCSERCAGLVRLSGMLLQEGCRQGLSLHDVASMMVRQDLGNQEPSALEVLMHAASAESATSASSASDCTPLLRAAAPQGVVFRPSGYKAGSKGGDSDDEEEGSGFWARPIEEAHSYEVERSTDEVSEEWADDGLGGSAPPGEGKSDMSGKSEFHGTFWAIAERLVKQLVHNQKKRP